MTDAERIEALEAKRADRRKAAGDVATAQRAADLEALDRLEDELGAEHVARLDVEGHVRGQPTFVALRRPSAAQYKRFCDQIARAAERQSFAARRDAQDLLAESVWVYPTEPAQRAAMLEHFPGLLVSIALRAAQMVEAAKEAEGKG